VSNTYIPTSSSIGDKAVLEEATTAINHRLLLAILRETPEMAQQSPEWQLPNGQIILIPLPASRAMLSVVLQHNPGFNMAPVSDAVYIANDGIVTGITPGILLQILTELWQLTPEVSDRLKTEVYNNLHNMIAALSWEKQHIVNRNAALENLLIPKSDIALRRNDLIFSEQLPLKGHPVHISAKTKLGFSPADVQLYSPEFGRQVQLRIAAIRRSLVKEYGDATVWEQYIDRYLPPNADRTRYCYFPVHPWQLIHIISPAFDPYIQSGDIILNDDITLPAWPTLSFRTLATAQQTGLPCYHIKLPVHIHATSGTRILSPRAISNSLLLTGLIKEILQTDVTMQNYCRIAADLYGAHFQSAADLSFMIRKDPAEVTFPGESIIVTAALTHTSSQVTYPLIARYIQRAGINVTHYLSLLFKALLTFPLRIFLEYGIAVEGHAQNVLLILNEQHIPAAICLRDMSGIRCVDEHPYISSQAHLFAERERIIRNYEEAASKLVHCIYNNLAGELVQCISKYCHMPAAAIWTIIKTTSQQIICDSKAGEADKQRLSSLLFAPTLPVKALALMRAADVSVDYLYIQVSNPMYETEITTPYQYQSQSIKSPLP
jgi:siderophore synthetase component